jgi:hypothetical protein
MAERNAKPLGERGELGRAQAANQGADQAAAASKKYEEEKKTAQEAIKAMAERHLTDKEKELLLEKQIVEWRKLGMISKAAADTAVAQGRADLADRTPARAADALTVGTEEEYAHRVQMQMEAAQRMSGGAAAGDDQKRAADAAEKTVEGQDKMIGLLETLARKSGPATWQGAVDAAAGL